MRMPKRLKRHILNFIKFYAVYFVIATAVEGAQQIVGPEHYTIIRWGLALVYFSISAWFVWRFYTGMIRDMDFYDDYYRW